MSQILRDLNKLAKKVGAPVVGQNISEQIRALNTFWEASSHGANIAERINETAHSKIDEGGSPAVLIEKSVTANNTYNAADDNADGYSKVTVNVPSSSPTLIEKSITANGVYNASLDSADGYSKVTVNVDTNPQFGTTPAAFSFKQNHVEFEAVVPSGVTSLAEAAFSNTKVTDVTIPSTVTTIGNYAFQNCKRIEEIDIPDTVTSIGSYAFAGSTSLKTVTIKNADVGQYGFQGCTALEEIPDVFKTGYPWNTTSYSSNMFNGCTSIEEVDITIGTSGTGSYVFQDCTGLKSITLRKGNVKSFIVGANYARGCTSLETVNLPNEVTEIDSSAFEGCSSLSTINMPTSLTKIGGSAFKNCKSLETVVLPNTITGTNLNSASFSGCSGLESIILPNAITKITQQLLQGCSNLKTLEIPASVCSTASGNWIDALALEGLSSLEWLKFGSSVAVNAYSTAFSNLPTTCRILVPLGSYGAYTSKANYPIKNSYLYLCYNTYESGAFLPTASSDNYNLTWYASIADAVAETNPITTGNGEEVYARCTAQ